MEFFNLISMPVHKSIPLIKKKNGEVSGVNRPVAVIDVEGVPYHRVFTLTALNFAASSKASLTAGVDPCVLFWLPLRDHCPFCLSLL